MLPHSIHHFASHLPNITRNLRPSIGRYRFCVSHLQSKPASACPRQPNNGQCAVITRNYSKSPTREYSAGFDYGKVLRIVSFIPLFYGIYLGYDIYQANEAESERRQLELKCHSPTELPARSEDLRALEHRPVVLHGTFDNDNEVLIGPRTNINFSRSGLLYLATELEGFYLLTPFVLDDGRRFVVNRGWISHNRKSHPIKRSMGRVEGPTTLIGHVVLEEKLDLILSVKSSFYLNRWIYSDTFTTIDLEELSRKLSTEPVAYFVADNSSAVKNGPIPGQMYIEENKLSSYGITYKCLGLFAVFQVVSRLR